MNVCCPKCESANVRSFDNESLYHPTKQEVETGVGNYDSEAYLKFVCDDCNDNDSFTVVFKLVKEMNFEEGKLDTPTESNINSLIMEQASDTAEKLTELECKLVGIKCYNVEMEGDAEISSYTEEAQEIFDVYYDQQVTELYNLFNAQLNAIQ